ncbi:MULTISPECIES: Ku protein [unclassified Beijerinckia]|uniref:non-homologous end joining protein Ku n=1 Tax=unclassified Beijerinckia TaxID=2638183 RepID=UPI00089C5FBF|nr:MULTISPECIES: Ku protein [unclassified Beijerinckia]MDH7796479.1 DNA end-binding protein Ku [Beijerinckia sp. GAS462]SEC46892.1 Ku protein [Beijerinckia sp. 28-YEA-48]
MPIRPYWKGTLKLSLVSCPIALFPATTLAERTHFHQINRKTKHRLRQQMVDEVTGRAVDKANKGRGYEVGKGRYVEIDEEDLDALKIESTKTIDIDSFVPAEEVEDLYRDRPYYLAPQGKVGADAFAVIRDAMKDKGRVALARIVLSNREHVMAIEPHGDVLMGTTLRYPYEVREASDVIGKITKPRITKDMVKIAEHILESKEASFDPSKFKDRYETALRALVKRKAAGKAIVAREESAEDRGNVIDLMEALRRSIGHGGKSGRKKPAKTANRRKPARRKAA